MVRLPESLHALKQVAKEVGLDLRGASLNLDGEADLKKRQTKATKDYEDAYQMLAKAYKEALTDLAPQS